MTAERAALIMGGIGAVAVLIDSSETLWSRTSLSSTGIFAPRVVRNGRSLTAAMARSRAFSWVFDYPSVLVLPVLQLVAALVVLVAVFSDLGGQQRTVIGVASGAIVLARVLFYGRNALGLDGSDQMLLIVFASVCVASLSADAAPVALCFAAAQVVLCYTASGIAKAISPAWRGGTALVGITGTLSYGNAGVSRLLTAHRSLAWASCWGVILWESSACLWLLGGHDGAIAFAAIAVSFHVGVALVMGLNIFFWSFSAALPSVVFLVDYMHGSALLPFLR
jgi:hypothetical protein